MFRCISAMVLLALLSGQVNAQSCYYGGTRQGSYYSPNVSYYTHGGHNYYQYKPQQYGYEHHKDYVVQKVVAQEIAVAPLIVTVPVVSHALPIHNYGATHYYSAQEQYQQKASIRDIIREELRNFVSGGQGKSAPANPAPTPAPPTPPPLYPSTAPPATPGAPGSANSTRKATDLGEDTEIPEALSKPVVAAFKETGCFTCHGNITKGDLRLGYNKGGENWTLAKHSQDRRWVIYGMASTGWMPEAARKDASKAMKQQHLSNLLRWTLEGN